MIFGLETDTNYMLALLRRKFGLFEVAHERMVAAISSCPKTTRILLPKGVA